MDQIYSMMKKEEENFLVYSFQIDDKIYGICNVYSQRGNLLNLNTEDLEYSFSFSYDEKQDKLYKVNEYTDRGEDIELSKNKWKKLKKPFLAIGSDKIVWKNINDLEF